MADDPITISELDPTAVPSLLHELPAMLGGLTVKLTVAQLRAVMLGGADNVALALKDLSNTVGPRGRVGQVLTSAANYNDLQEIGIWTIPAGGTNAPEALAAYTVRVETSTTGYIIQYARAHELDAPSDSKLYRREYNGGWTSWVRVREAEAELDARYMRTEPGDLVLTWRSVAPAGCFKANGAAVSRATYVALDTNIYCGDALNPTAAWGYRCTNPANPNGSRSTTGTHIVLPDARGEFLRGWIDDRTLSPETGRNQFTLELDAFQDHVHQMSRSSNITLSGGGSSDVYRSGSEYLNGLSVPTGAGYRFAVETRPRNLTPLICIRYAY